jgi:hypothetical protein
MPSANTYITNSKLHCRDLARGVDKRAIRVKIAKRFSRLALACVAGDEPMRHPCFQKPDSILDKLRRFHQQHGTPMDVLLADLESAVGHLPYNTCNHEAEIVADVLEQHTRRRRGAGLIGDFAAGCPGSLKYQNHPSKQKQGPVLNSCEDSTPPSRPMAFLPVMCMALFRITTA